MMKSFFKKLAFVMALAMVVSLAAPAGSALAAESLNITVQGTRDVITEYNLPKVGDTVDFQFWKAPSNWATDYEWDCTRPGIVSVDQAGFVTALAEGTTTVTITVLGTYYGEVEVTVGEVAKVEPTTAPVEPTTAPVEPTTAPVEPTVAPEAKEAFTVEVTSPFTFDVLFANKASYTRDDVNLYRVFNTDKGDVYVVWAVMDGTKMTDDTTMLVKPYIELHDGERYLIAFKDIEKQLNEGNDLAGIDYCEFVVEIGEPETVKLSYVSKIELDGEEKTYKNIAYTNGEDAEVDFEVVLGYKLYSGKVDVTSLYENEGYMEYTLTNEDDVADYITLSDDTLVFTKAYLEAKINATYVFENEEGEEDYAYGKDSIYAVQPKAFSVDYVKDWSFTNGKKVDWTKTDKNLRAGQTNRIALLIVDSRGGEWEINGGNDKIADFGTGETEGMYLRFYSTDNDHFLVDDYGDVETYIKLKKAVVYVALHDDKLLEEYDDNFVRNIGACVMEIQEPAEFSEIVVVDTANKNKEVTSVTLVTNAIVDPANTGRFVKEFTTNDKLKVVANDQDGTAYDPTKDEVLPNTHIDYVVSTTDKALREEMSDNGCHGFTLNANGTLEIDARSLREETSKTSVTFKITATQYDGAEEVAKKTTSFKVYLRDPEFVDEAKTIVKPTSWAVEAGNKGLMQTSGLSTADIKVPMLSKSYTVGLYNRYDMDESLAAGTQMYVVDNTENYVFSKTSKVVKENGEGIYVMVINPDGKALKTASDAALTASGTGLGVVLPEAANNYSIGVNVTADTDGDGDLEFAETGKYTVKITFVTKATTDGDGNITAIEYKTRTATFNVNDDIDHVTFYDMKDVVTSLDIEDTTATFDELDAADKATLINIIQENYKFKFDDGNKNKVVDWVPEDDEIDDVSFIIRGGYVTIKSITFRIYSDNGDYYTTTTRNINRAVKLDVAED